MAYMPGANYDLGLNFEGYMLAPASKGGTSYKKYSKNQGGASLNPVGPATDSEEMRGVSPARSVAPFKRLFWSNWRGLGRRYQPGGVGFDDKEGRVSDLVALRPVLDGQALALAPQGVSAVALAAPLSNAEQHSAALGSVQVVSFGSQLLVSANPGTNNTGFVYKATAAAAVKGLTVWNGGFLAGVSGANIQTFDPAAGTLAAFAPASTGERLFSYQGVLFASVGAVLKWYIPAVGAWSAGITLESLITSLEELEGSLYIGTLTALYRLDGQLKPKAPSTSTALDFFDYTFNLVYRPGPYFGSGNSFEFNFVKMTAWAGSLWFFAGGRFYRGTPKTNKQIDFELQPVYGPCRGMAVCSGMLVVATRNPSTSGGLVWVNDGLFARGDGGGWWKLLDALSGSNYQFPFPNAGYMQGVINLADIDAYLTSHTFVRYLIDNSSPLGFKSDNYSQARTSVTGRVVLPFLAPEDLTNTAGGKVEAVQLLRVGCEWSVVDGGRWWPTIDAAAAFDSQGSFELSRDGGSTWTTLVITQSGGYSSFGFDAPTFLAGRVEFPVPEAASFLPLYPAANFYNTPARSDPGWLVRVSWQGKNMPLLRRVWLDVRPVEVEQELGTIWEVDLQINAPVITRDGQRDTKTAGGSLNNLWTLWQSGTPFLLTDIDNLSQYTVKIVAIEQRLGAQSYLPGTATPTGTAPPWLVGLKLVEVRE